MCKLLIVLSCLAVSVPVALANQNLTGSVQDATGAALGSAVVTLMDEDTGVRRIVQTSTDGTYTITGLPAGLYRLAVRRPGFQTIVRWNVKIEPATEARLNVVMLVGSMRSMITVEGTSAAMNAADASVGTLIGHDAVEHLPLNGRGVMSLVDLSPGVVATPAANGEAGQFSTNGLRANTNYFTIDGVSANTGVSGGGLPAQFAGNALPSMTAFGSTHNLVTPEALEEVRLLTSSFAPEHGRLPGAQVALTTRSGSNDYHGSVFYALRNEALAANDWFANALNAGSGPLRLNQWGASLGGPLRKNRTFAFLSCEGLRLLQPLAETIVTPSAAIRSSAPPAAQPILNAFPTPDAYFTPALSSRTASFSRPSRVDTTSLRIDHAMSDHVTLFGRFNRAPSYTESGFAQVEHFHLDSSSLTFGITTALSSGISNDARTNIWSTSATAGWSTNPAAGGVPLDYRTLFNRPPNPAPAFYAVAIGGVGVLYSGENGRNRQKQWNLVDTFAIRHDSHDIRVGIDYQRLTPARETSAQSTAGQWNSLHDLLAGVPPLLMSVRAEQASALVETLSTFAQDTWSVTPRLSLTYGVRWELTPPPSFTQPSGAFAAAITTDSWRTRYNQFAPRVGAAFRTSQNSVIRAGWGVFYDVAFSTALDPINGFPFNRWQYNFGSAPTIAADSPAFGLYYGSNLRLPYTQQWNVAYERMISRSDFVSASYVVSSGRRLSRYEGVPQPGSTQAQYLIATNNGQSDYHGLELQYKRRFAQGLQALAAYTWSHSIDNGSSDSGVYLAGQPAAADRGSSSFDVRHNLTAGITYSVPSAGRTRLTRLASNWQASAVLRVRSGFPVDILTTENLLGLGFDDLKRPDLISGVPIWIPASSIGGRALNPSAFAAPAGAQGNLGRNAISGSGMSQVDIALERRFPIARTMGLDLRIEAYNALNHPNPADPVRFLDSPLFGKPVSMLDLMLGSGSARSGLTPAFQIGGPRVLQLQLRLRF